MIKLIVLVEGNYDAVWVNALLHRAISRSDVAIVTRSCKGKQAVYKDLVSSTGQVTSLYEETVVVGVVDSDSPSIADARAQVDSHPLLSRISDRIFFAVPTIEAWLFADIEAARRHLVRHDTSALERISFPEEMPLPKYFAMQIFGGHRGLESAGLKIMQEMSIDRAISRSPSMREFLAGVSRLLGQVSNFETIPDAEKLLGRRLLGSLIAETNPSERILYRTMAGERVSAKQLTDAIKDGTPLARQYAADLLRVARELLAQESDESEGGVAE